jgi:hypothetical protein
MTSLPFVVAVVAVLLLALPSTLGQKPEYMKLSTAAGSCLVDTSVKPSCTVGSLNLTFDENLSIFTYR